MNIQDIASILMFAGSVFLMLWGYAKLTKKESAGAWARKGTVVSNLMLFIVGTAWFIAA